MPMPMTSLSTGSRSLVVVGAGYGGLSTAIRAQELGASATVLEATPTTPAWSNSRMSGARWHIAYLSPNAGADRLAAEIMAVTGGTARPDVLAAFVRDAPRAFGWIQCHGARFINLKGARVMTPVRPNRTDEVWPGRAGEVVLAGMQREFVARGGRLLQEHRAIELRWPDGRVAGVVAETASGERVRVEGSAVVLADGGFQGNAELMRDVGRIPRPDLLVTRGAGSGRGDALQMAMDAGALIASPEAIYGHMLHRDALTDRRISQYPMLDKMSLGSVVVAGDARRFYDEQLGGLAGANRIAHLEDPSNVWLVFDREVWEREARLDQIVPPNPNLAIKHARIVRAETPEELAERTGLPGDALARTLDEFNAAAATGRLRELAIPRGGSPRPLRAPLYAVPLTVGVTHTFGGPVVDGHARVLDREERPIPGLYAVGSASAGLSGGPNPGYVGGVSVAVGLALLAAEHAVAGIVGSTKHDGAA